MSTEFETSLTSPASGSHGKIRYRTPYVNMIFGPLYWRSRLVSWPMIVMRQRKNIFSTNYDLLVEGFPRCANTFSVRLLKTLNPLLRIASHMHTPAAITTAISAQKPVLLLIREPIDAVASWVVRSSYSPASAFQYYEQYYTIARRYISSVVTADFAEVTSDFSPVIERLNRKYGLRLNENRPGTIELRSVFDAIESEFTREDGVIDELKVCRPSSRRETFLNAVRSDLLLPKYRQQMHRAQSVYLNFVKLAADSTIVEK